MRRYKYFLYWIVSIKVKDKLKIKSFNQSFKTKRKLYSYSTCVNTLKILCIKIYKFLLGLNNSFQLLLKVYRFLYFARRSSVFYSQSTIFISEIIDAWTHSFTHVKKTKTFRLIKLAFTIVFHEDFSEKSVS